MTVAAGFGIFVGLGVATGSLVGCLVGLLVIGFRVGRVVGLSVIGLGVGCFVGCFVGCCVGCFVGLTVTGLGVGGGVVATTGTVTVAGVGLFVVHQLSSVYPMNIAAALSSSVRSGQSMVSVREGKSSSQMTWLTPRKKEATRRQFDRA